MVSKDYIEPEIPSEFKMRRAIAGKSEDLVWSYEAWRVLRIDASTGEVVSMCKCNGNEDYLTERNAKCQAAKYNNLWRKVEPSIVYLARKCKITVEAV